VGFCFSCRNKSNRGLIPIRIADDQETTITIHPHSHKPLFLVIAIFNSDGTRVIEHCIDIGQSYPVFADIGLVLKRIEFNVHASIIHTLYIYTTSPYLRCPRGDSLTGCAQDNSVFVGAQFYWAISRSEFFNRPIAQKICAPTFFSGQSQSYPVGAQFYWAISHFISDCSIAQKICAPTTFSTTSISSRRSPVLLGDQPFRILQPPNRAEDLRSYNFSPNHAIFSASRHPGKSALLHCQRQASRHISSIPRVAFQPSSFSASAGSA